MVLKESAWTPAASNVRVVGAHCPFSSARLAGSCAALESRTEDDSDIPIENSDIAWSKRSEMAANRNCGGTFGNASRYPLHACWSGIYRYEYARFLACSSMRNVTDIRFWNIPVSLDVSAA